MTRAFSLQQQQQQQHQQQQQGQQQQQQQQQGVLLWGPASYSGAPAGPRRVGQLALRVLYCVPLPPPACMPRQPGLPRCPARPPDEQGGGVGHGDAGVHSYEVPVPGRKQQPQASIILVPVLPRTLPIKSRSVSGVRALREKQELARRAPNLGS